MDDNDDQIIFGDRGDLKFPKICLTGEEKLRKNLTQETCPDRGSNPVPLRDKRACTYIHTTYIIIVFCSRVGFSLQTQGPRLQLCQSQVFRCKLRNQIASLLGINRCGSFPLLFAPHSLFSIWKDLKRPEKVPRVRSWR